MGKMEKLKIKDFLFFGMMTAFFLLPSTVVRADDAPAVSEAEFPDAPQSELDRLKTEWETVREQQIQMIREKEDQLEKLKEEIFAKMKALNAPAAPESGVLPQDSSDVPGPSLLADNGGAVASGSSFEIEAQKEALQAERQKFFKEMSRQKESLRQLQFSLAEKAKKLDAERERFEQEKKMAAS